MILNNSVLAVDIKVQEKYRALLANLGNSTDKLNCVILGDSDVNYELSQNMDNSAVLNTPYNSEGIKYRLIYNGAGKGLTGTVTGFVRFVDATGNVSSLYNYPTTTNLTQGKIPPSLDNGYNWDKILFSDSKLGAIIFAQTLLDYYLDANGVPMRLKEVYNITVTFSGSEAIPTGWQVTKDLTNGSVLIGKSAVAVTSTSVFNGLVTIEGKTTGNKKYIQFNV